MPRNFTAFVGQTDSPDTILSEIESVLDDQPDYEQVTPRVDVSGRIRIEGRPWFHHELHDALSEGRLEPIDWAVVMVAMDEAIGVNAWVYDGTERIDTFEGKELLDGLDTEAYLERFHGVLVDRAGPYAARMPYNPSLGLADKEPESTLIDTPPSPPFEVTGTDGWFLLIAETDAPESFSRYVTDQLHRNTDFTLGSRDTLINRNWVPDWTTVETATDGSRARIAFPLSTGGITDEGLFLPFGFQEFDGSLNWIIGLYGDAQDECVDGWIFLAPRRSRLTFDEAEDSVEGELGQNGQDIAAYVEEYYGLQIDPTPDRLTLSEPPGDVPPDQHPRTNWISEEDIERSGVDFTTD